MITVLAAWGSLITALKSTWELSRMIKKNLAKNDVERRAQGVFRDLRRAYYNGLISDEELDDCYDMILDAIAENDSTYSGS